MAYQCLQGWSEQNEIDNIYWRKLVEYVDSDTYLLNKVYDLDEIYYFL